MSSNSSQNLQNTLKLQNRPSPSNLSLKKTLNLTLLFFIISLKEPALMIQTVISGLQIYFDRALGTNLLYRFERAQYAQVRHDYWTGPKVIVGTEKEMCLIYGAEHFLRMLGMCFVRVYSFWLTIVLSSSSLVSLPQMIAHSSLDVESVNILRDYANELLV